MIHIKNPLIKNSLLTLGAVGVISVVFFGAAVVAMKFKQPGAPLDPRLIISLSFFIWGTLLSALFAIWQKSEASLRYRAGVWLLSSAVLIPLIYFFYHCGLIWVCVSGFTAWILLRRKRSDWVGPPASVVVAAAILGYFFILRGYDLFHDFPETIHHGGGGMAIALVILAYVLLGNRLAWQWGRYAAFGTVILIPLITLVNIGNKPSIFTDLAAQVIVMVLPAFLIALALGRPSARVFFRLVCPACQSQSVKPADFFFRRVKCKKCVNVWP